MSGEETPTAEQLQEAFEYWAAGLRGSDGDEVLRFLAKHDAQVKAAAWDEGATTALNHAIRNDDGVTLRLEHLDGRSWENPYRKEGNRG